LKRQLLQFAAAGAAGFVVDAGVLYAALGMGMGYFSGRAVSFLCAVFTTWLINRNHAFSDRRERHVAAEFGHYVAAMALGGAVNYGVYSAVIMALPRGRWTPLVALAAGVSVGMAINYATSRFWVFRKR
jgi:putative flippase GtrA